MEIPIAILAAAILAACHEAPQRLASAEKPGYQTDAWPEQHRERTLRQDESSRIYH